MHLLQNKNRFTGSEEQTWFPGEENWDEGMIGSLGWTGMQCCILNG